MSGLTSQRVERVVLGLLHWMKHEPLSATSKYVRTKYHGRTEGRTDMPKLKVIVCNLANETLKALLCYGTIKMIPVVVIPNSNILAPCNMQNASSLRTDFVTERQKDRHDEEESLFSQVFKRDITLHSCSTWLYGYNNEHKLFPHLTIGVNTLQYNCTLGFSTQTILT